MDEKTEETAFEMRLESDYSIFGCAGSSSVRSWQ